MKIEYLKTDADARGSYTLNVKRAVVITLVLLNSLVLLSPKVKLKSEDVTPPQITIDVENIPITRQSRRTPPPPRPTVPVPSDDETIPEDETIEETTLKYTTFYDDFPNGVPAFKGIRITPPKPLALAFPEYPEKEKKRGVQGVVKLSVHVSKRGKVIEVVVLENTTGSEKCAQAAIEAAYGSRYFPAKEGNKFVSYWISQPYSFGLRN